jgi:hypothetical protein
VSEAVLKVTELTPGGVEQRLNGTRAFTAKAGGWDTSLTSIKFDLSRCTRVELAGAVELLVVLDAAARAGIRAGFIQPIVGPTDRELHALGDRPNAARHIERSVANSMIARSVAASMLDRLGFWDAARLDHLPDVVVDVKQDDAAPLGAGAPQRLLAANSEIAAQHERSLVDAREMLQVPAAFKLRWITALEPEQLENLAADLSEVISQGKAAVVPIHDARSIARTILVETLENVRSHAGFEDHDTPAAVLGAAFDRSSSASRHELRIVVGDAGRGIGATLGPSFRRAEHSRFLPTRIHGWQHEPMTVAWAFHPLSTSRSTVEGLAPTRGLSRTRHEVRYFGGQLRVRTGACEVRWDFQANAEAPQPDRDMFRAFPGTVIDIRLPPTRRTRLPAVGSGGGQDPLVVGVHPLADPLAAAMTVAASIADVPDDTPLVVVLTARHSLDDAGQTVRDYIRSIAAQALARLTLVVFPSVPDAELFANLEALSEVEGGTDADPDHLYPTMVLGADRRFMVVGGSDQAREHLYEAATRTGFRPPAGLDRGDELLPSNDSASRPELPLDEAGLHRSLLDWGRAQIASRISTGGAGVVTGDRLLPNLDGVSRFLDVGTILRDLQLSDLLGQEAARSAEARLTDPIALLAVLPDVPATVSTAFRAALAYDGLATRVDPNEIGWRMHPPPDPQAGRVVLVGGMRHTGESLSAVAEQFMRWGLEVQLAVVLFDAQKGAELDTFRGSVPVSGLVQVEVPSSTVSAPDLARQDYLAWSSNADLPLAPDVFFHALEAAGIGFSVVHVERESQRHLVGYYDFPAMLDHPNVRDLAVSNVAAEIRRRTGTASPDRVLLCYPGDDERSAGELARLVAEVLELDSPRPLPRPARGVTYPLALGKVVAFIDWGVVTSKTARAVLRGLVEGGATEAHFVAMTSQLDEDGELDLRSIAALHREVPAVGQADLLEKRPTVTEVVPVSFGSVTRVDSTHFTRATCPLCVTVSAMSQVGREIHDPVLASVARDKVGSLRPRTRDQALARPRDLYDMSLTPKERATLIRLWHELHLALTQPWARLQLLTTLRTTDPAERAEVGRALCRIVTARHDLLHSPPLSYRAFRTEIARLALDRVLSDPASPVRRQAIVALRGASKPMFVESLSSIVQANSTRRDVVRELAFSIHSIAARPYYRGAELLERLLAELVQCEDLVRSAPLADDIDPDIRDSVSLLRRSVELEVLRAAADVSPPDAWAELKQSYAPHIELHHHALNTLAVLIRGLKDLATSQAVESDDERRRRSSLDRLVGNWHECAGVVATAILPYLPALRAPLSSAYYRERVASGSDWSRWLRLLKSDLAEADLDVPVLLNELRADPSAFDEQARQDLEDAAEWLARFLLPPLDDRSIGDPRGGAYLYDWLQECPVRVDQVLEYLKEQARGYESDPTIHVDDQQRPVRLFVPEGLMRELVDSLIKNKRRHAPEATLLVRVSTNAEAGTATLEFSNESVGDRPADEGPAHGALEGVRQRMAPFSAALDWNRSVGAFDLRWTALTMGRPDGRAH